MQTIGLPLKAEHQDYLPVANSLHVMNVGRLVGHQRERNVSEHLLTRYFSIVEMVANVRRVISITHQTSHYSSTL